MVASQGGSNEFVPPVLPRGVRAHQFLELFDLDRVPQLWTVTVSMPCSVACRSFSSPLR